LAAMLGQDDHREEAGGAEAGAEQHDRVADDLAVGLGHQHDGAVAAQEPREGGAADAVPGEALLELLEGVQVAPFGAPDREAARRRHPATVSFTASSSAGPTRSTSPTMA